MTIIPFRLTLAGLTLKGKHYDVAEAHHDLEGEALERRLLEIETDKDKLPLELLNLDLKYGHITQEQFDVKEVELTMEGDEKEIELLVLQRKYKHITKEEYDYQLVELKYKDSIHDTDLPFARFELDKKYGKLTEKEFDKAVYSLGNRPWVDIIHSKYNDNEKSDGFEFEFDWNAKFIEVLRSEGYNGATEEEIVEQWFEDKSLDTYLGVLNEQMEEIGTDPEDAHASTRQSRASLRERLSNNQSRHS